MKKTLAALLLLPSLCFAEPVARFSAGDVAITLHNTPCALTGEITNLKRRAVWLEGGKATEGCWGISAQFGFVAMYFSDKTATALPMQVFEKVTGA